MQYIDCYCVDNALARVADPHLAGHADLRQADVCEPSALSLRTPTLDSRYAKGSVIFKHKCSFVLGGVAWKWVLVSCAGC